jgi:GLPGLI family protein
MKKYILYLLLIFTCQLFAQKYKITYSFSLNIDADTIKNQDKKYYYKNYFLNKYQNSYGVLWINKEGAFFEQEGELKSQYNNTYLQNFYTSLKLKKLFGKNSIYFNLPQKYNYRTFEYYNWKITTETKKINNFLCYKATGTVKALNAKAIPIEAWFCPEISLPYGPENYAGLPGLIFEVYQTNGRGHHWKLKSIEKNKEKKFTLPADDDAISNEQMSKMYYEERIKLLKM